jgi:hypothetical protein
LRPLGPRVTLTVSARILTPRSIARRAVSSKNRLFPIRDYFFSMMARTSRAERTRYSSLLYLTSVPPYLLYRTTSPTWTSIGIRTPSSKRPGPTATTVPSCGFSLAVSGITKPEAVVCSASLAFTTIRSSSGLMLLLLRT